MSHPAYYNETDPIAAEWLRNLIKFGIISQGDVDERSIEDVHPSDLAPYTQCHFFAGIGIWSLALRRAGWLDDRRVWTGSCPCQPFSAAGKGSGFADERHLWPAWHHLIRERRPAVIFGEQVASKDAGPWLDLVQTDVEAMDYAFGAIPFPAASVGAPNIRDRLYWVADSDLYGRAAAPFAQLHHAKYHAQSRGLAQRLAHAGSERIRDRGRGPHVAATRGSEAEGLQRERLRHDLGDDGHGLLVGVADTHSGSRGQGGSNLRGGPAGSDAEPWSGLGSSSPFGGLPEHCTCDGCLFGAGPCVLRRLADTSGLGSQGRLPGRSDAERGVVDGPAGRDGAVMHEHPGPTNGIWRDVDWLFCRDGKWRPVEPGTFPLATGHTNRVGRLRAYGNAINAEAASTWISTYLEAQEEVRSGVVLG